MTAIYGAVGPISHSEFTAMGNRLTHRGLNQEIKNVSKDVIFGCNFQDGNCIFQDYQFTIVASASIYNRDELHNYIFKKGSNLKTDYDTELILKLYALEGSFGISKINGDFAFGIWDDEKKLLILCKDYLGTRPFYYTFFPTGLLSFSSEYKALLCINEFLVEPDLDMIQYLQHYKHLPAEKTLLKNIYAAPPGSLFVFNALEKSFHQTNLPSLDFKINYLSEKECANTLVQSILNAVNIRAFKQDKIGIALSGGIDSIGIACAYRCCNPYTELHTFSAGYGKDDPELKTAAYVAKKIKSKHHEIQVNPETLEKILPPLVWHLEDPIARNETVQFYEIGHEASQFVDILLMGLASDGLFAGMPKHKILWLMKLFPPLKNPLTEFYQLTQSGVRPKGALAKILSSVYFRGKLPDVPKISGSHFYPELLRFPKINKEFINSVLATGFQKSVPTWLSKVERLLSAWNITYSSPFFDKNLINFAFSIPDAYKIKRWKEKYILRQAIKSIVPEEVLNVPKFPMRMNSDLPFSNAIDMLSDKYLTKEQVQSRNFFDYNELLKLRQRRSNKPYSFEWAMRIWTVLLTEIWAIEFLDKKGRGPKN